MVPKREHTDNLLTRTIGNTKQSTGIFHKDTRFKLIQLLMLDFKSKSMSAQI